MGRARLLDRPWIGWLSLAGFAAFVPVGVLYKQGMASIFIALAVLCLLIAAMRDRRAVIPDRRTVIFGLALLAWVAIGPVALAGCADCALNAVQKLTMVALILGVAAAPFLATERLDGDRLARWLSVAMVGAAALYVVEIAFHAPVYRLLSGLSGDADVAPSRFNRGLTAVVVLAWPAAAMLARAGRRWTAALVIASSLLAAAIGESASARVAALAAVLGFAISLRAPVLALAAGLAITAVLLLAAPFLFAHTLAWTGDRLAALPPSFAERLEIWDFVSRRILDGPWHGHGIDQIRTFAIDTPERYRLLEQAPTHPHSAVLQLWLDLGWAGPLFGLGALWLVLSGVLRLARELQPFAVATTGAVLVIAMVSYGIWQETWLAIIAMAVLGIRWAARGA
jgi:exopolysaccharide production protein ExoQ